MLKYFSQILYFSIVVFSIVSCQSNLKKVDRAFYYWKSNSYSLENSDEEYIAKLAINNLYIKLFEVETDQVLEAIPTVKSDIHIWDSEFKEDSVLKKQMSKLKLIPTVYIRNEVFDSINQVNFDSLAVNVFYLIDKLFTEQIKGENRTFSEIQIDCDWTAKTKDNYFYFLNALKLKSAKKISCTLRLYPYAYSKQMGVPPVDKVSLMCYNLLSPLGNEDKNSIQDNNELILYLKQVKNYPLHIDVVLPVFSWIQLYQNNQFKGLIRLDQSELNNISKPLKKMWLEVTKDTVVDDIYVRIGDKIKYEEVNYLETKKSIDLLVKYLPFDDSTTVSLFHLDSKNLKQYKHEELNSFFSDFIK